MKILRIALVCALLATAGSASAKDHVFPAKDPYGKVLRHYTKQADEYSLQDLHAQFILYATYASEEFRNAFRVEYERVYPYGQDARAKERAAPWLAQDPEANFFVAIYARKRENMILAGEKSLQDLSLHVDGKTYKPKLIEKISITPFEIYFFNYLNLWFDAYRVVFPFEGLHNRDLAFQLQLHGVSGSGNLNFKKK